MQEQPPKSSSLPALTPEAIAAHIAGWPRNCQSYIMARLRDPERPKADICRDVVGLDPQATYRWRHGGLYGPGVAGFAELDDAITQGKPMLQLEMANATMLNSAPMVAEMLVRRATEEIKPETDRQLQVAHQSRVTVLEAVGLLKKAPIVNIDNRRVDVRAMELWQQGGAAAWSQRNRSVIPDKVAPAEPAAPTEPN